jgi:hypothetical protein
MAFGQPRQAELVAAMTGYTDDELAQVREAVTTDLAPAARNFTSGAPRHGPRSADEAGGDIVE